MVYIPYLRSTAAVSLPGKPKHVFIGYFQLDTRIPCAILAKSMV